MDIKWLHRKGNRELIVFYNGWGMDEKPFNSLTSAKYDILFCFNYIEENNKPDITQLAITYDKIVLIGWSMGVFFAQRHLAEYRDYFSQLIAVNGTLAPIHDIYGIPLEVVRSTLQHLNEIALLKFFKRMCRSKTTLEKFLHSKPEREIPDIQRELQYILNCKDENIDEKDSIFSDVIIADKDFIMPSRNQTSYWKKSRTHHIHGVHFPFYQYKTWDNLIESTYDA